MSKHLNFTNIMIALLFIGAIFTQQHFNLHGDIGYLTLVSEQFINGKRYGIDIFETNPPMILYLYYPFATLAHVLHLNVTTVLRIEFFSIMLISVILCQHLLKRITNNNTSEFFIMLAVIFSVGFISAHQFGQREHLTLMLTLPYFFYSALVLKNKHCPLLLQIMVGVLAGIGFSIKPYFIIPFVLVELAIIMTQHRLFAWWRLPTLIIGTTMVAYLASTSFLAPEYFHVLFPYLKAFYFTGIHQPWMSIATSLVVDYCLGMIIGGYIFYRFAKQTDNALLVIFSVALAGFTLSFLVTRTTWFYHEIPAIGMACILSAILASDLANMLITKQNTLEQLYKRTIVLFAFMLLASLPIANTFLITSYHWGDSTDPTYQQLVSYIKSSPNHGITCFSANTTSNCFPLQMDANTTYASRFPFFWWTTGALRLEKNHPQLFQKKRPQLAKLIGVVYDDIQKQKPSYIIINQYVSTLLHGKEFNMFDFLTRHYPRFARIQHEYKLTKQIGYFTIYKRQQTHT